MPGLVTAAELLATLAKVAAKPLDDERNWQVSLLSHFDRVPRRRGSPLRYQTVDPALGVVVDQRVSPQDLVHGPKPA
jgi:hypothetical protein